MNNQKKQYERKRDQITKTKKISEIERSTQYFENWMNYIFSSVSTNEKESLKYESEKVRIRVTKSLRLI